MGGGMAANDDALANGDAFEVLTVRVTSPGDAGAPLPERLSRIQWPRLADAVNLSNPRSIELQMGQGRVALNNRTFRMTEVASDEVVRAGSTEIWEFVNVPGHMPHPMHIHNVQFQVIERRRSSRDQSDYETVKDGLIDEGWKDVVIVMPGERVRVLVKFVEHTGLYLYHCHILEHEDLGMMRNYRIEA